MDRDTVDVYERRAREWRDRRTPVHDRSIAFGRLLAGRELRGPVADLGCGPGWFTADLGPGAIALDASAAMLDLVAEHAPGAPRVRADLAALPFRRGALGAAWASKSYVHVARSHAPMAFAELHRAVAVGAPVAIQVFAGDREHDPYENDDFPGRRFSEWDVGQLRDVLHGAGFAIETIDARGGSRAGSVIHVAATRARTLADTVGPGMRLLVCGLNPSIYAADAGVGFARPGNRFWPAAIAAGLVTRDRDPVDALDRHAIGMTDLVKRATPRADELTPAEYRDGLARIERLAGWLAPAAVCFVGLAGWRAAVDRGSGPGVQEQRLGGRPVYVMGSTSGANASSSIDDLAAHLRAAQSLADRA